MTPLLDLMTNNEDVLKVFHAGGQDVEIIYNFTGRTPHPIFDTQIAMMAISQSEQIGYSNLVECWLGIAVDKGARFTDWSRRPLTERQIEYAIGDVTHLAKIFPKILNRLMQDRARRMARCRDGKARRSGKLPQRSRNRPGSGSRRPGAIPAMLGRLKALAALARAGSAGQEHPARPHRARRNPGRYRQPSAQDPGRPRQGARAFGGLEGQRDRPAADGGAGRRACR